MRNSFVLYTSYQEQLNLLTMEQRGVLLTAIMAYTAETELPEMDGITAMAFSFIRADIDKNSEKYEKTCNARRESGQKGGRPKEEKANGFSEKQKKQMVFSESKEKQKKQMVFLESKEKQKNPDNEYEYEDDNDITVSSNEDMSELPADNCEYKAIIDHLNEKTGSKYRASSAVNRKHIRARYRDGYKTVDFFTVIDKKVAEWKGDPKMEKYLCPETLFGSKFEKYLNQPETKTMSHAAAGRNERNYDMDMLEYELLMAQWGVPVDTG